MTAGSLRRDASVFAPGDVVGLDDAAVHAVERLLCLVRCGLGLASVDAVKATEGATGKATEGAARLGPVTRADVELAMRHGVSGEVDRAAAVVGVAADARDLMAAVGRHRRASALRQRSAAVAILVEFDRVGVPVVMFKGIALAAQTGLAPTDRPGMDLDLLVARTHRVAAHEALLRLGFEQTSIAPRPADDLRTTWVTAVYNECAYRRADVEVDLHWRLLPGYPRHLTTDHVLRRRVEVSVGSTVVPTMHPDDALAYAWLNGAKEDWTKARSLIDITLLVTAAGADMARAAALLDDSVAADEGRCALALLVGTDGPARYDAPTGRSGDDPIARRVVTHGLVAGAPEVTDEPARRGRWARGRRKVTLVPGARTAAATVGLFVISPDVLQETRIPRRLWMLSVVERPREALRQVAHRMARRPS